MKNKVIYLLFSAFFLYCLFTSSSSLHPVNPTNGFTRAPLDRSCNECHSAVNNNLSGMYEIIGLPEVLFRNETYDLTFRIINPDGDAARAGFQMVAVQESFAGAGNFIAQSDDMVIRKGLNRDYAGHNPAVPFGDDRIVEWNMEWVIDSIPDGEIGLYSVAMIANGLDGNRGDRPIFRNWSIPLVDSTEAVDIEIVVPTTVFCSEADSTEAYATIRGGVPPYSMSWNTGSIEDTIDITETGLYSVVIEDNIGNRDTAEVDITLSQLEILDVESTPTSSAESMDGSITVTASGDQILLTYVLIAESGDTIATNLDGVFLDLDNGNYTVAVSDEYDCGVISDTITISFSSSDIEIVESSWEVSPNPVRDILYIDSDSSIDEVTLYALSGQPIMHVALPVNNMDVSHLPQGIYLLAITSGSVRISKKIYKIE